METTEKAKMSLQIYFNFGKMFNWSNNRKYFNFRCFVYCERRLCSRIHRVFKSVGIHFCFAQDGRARERESFSIDWTIAHSWFERETTNFVENFKQTINKDPVSISSHSFGFLCCFPPIQLLFIAVKNVLIMFLLWIMFYLLNVLSTSNIYIVFLHRQF